MSVREILVAAMLCLTAVNSAAAGKTINPGEIWPDNRGKHIQAHGGGVIKLTDTYYWFGEDRSKENDPDCDGDHTTGL